MPKFAPVMPLQLMQKFMLEGHLLANHNLKPELMKRYSRKSYLLGNYHLLLAHDVVKKPNEWSTWASSLQLMNMGSATIIMDTSVIELGKSEEFPVIMDAASIVRADVIVLPDVIGDAAQTVNHALKFFEGDYFDRSKNYMFVPQGRNLKEYIQSLEAIASIRYITWIGIPRDALQFIPSRVDLVRASEIICPKNKIHLLGFSDNIYDDFVTLKSSPSIMGIDSAVPVRAGLNNQVFSLCENDYGKRGGYWDYDGNFTPLALHNIDTCRKYLVTRN